MALLEREEYIEQAYFFRTFRERLEEAVPAQDVLQSLRDELLATTKLPLAIDILRGELLHHGTISQGMAVLPHYFTPFQAYVLQKAEEDTARFDQLTALHLLEREADYRSRDPKPSGLFVYQFESLARNRLGYDRGMPAIAGDPMYDDVWKAWISAIRFRLGTTDFADLIYEVSELAHERLRERAQRTQRAVEGTLGPVLFGRQEGRLARANRGKDPLYLFAALQRHLGYPAVPRTKRGEVFKLHPQLENRLMKLEKHLLILDAEMKGKLDLSQFYTKDGTVSFTDDVPPPRKPD